MALSVIGAGLGRTGTMSLKLALERIGFGPCYHMKEVFERLDTDVPLWSRAAAGDMSVWDKLFEGSKSAVDFPAASFYRELADRYPAAKVILTVRSSPQSWHKSFADTILHPLTGSLPGHLAAWGEMVRRAILDRTFKGKADDPAHAIASYERHNEEVNRTIPRERLLVYEVSEGWGPLCRFLGVAVPDEPFPKANTTDEFRERFGPMLGGGQAGAPA